MSTTKQRRLSSSVSMEPGELDVETGFFGRVAPATAA